MFVAEHWAGAEASSIWEASVESATRFDHQALSAQTFWILHKTSLAAHHGPPPSPPSVSALSHLDSRILFYFFKLLSSFPDANQLPLRDRLQLSADPGSVLIRHYNTLSLYVKTLPLAAHLSLSQDTREIPGGFEAVQQGHLRDTGNMGVGSRGEEEKLEGLRWLAFNSKGARSQETASC